MDKYEDAERTGRKRVCWTIPPYGEDVEARIRERYHLRCNLEVQLIVSFYTERLQLSCLILYFSPIAAAERLQHAEGLTTAINLVRYMHLATEQPTPLPDSLGAGGVWIVDDHCSLRHIAFLLAQAARAPIRPRRMIFFVEAARHDVLAILDK